jgi:site-specific DNA-methyltransferase (adenine-specific)
LSATLYLGDCLHMLPMKADALISDPPYGIGFAHGGGGGCLAESTRFAGDAIMGDDAPFDPAPRLQYPIVVLWGGNHYASKLPDCACWLVWDKRDGVCSNDQADCELAWTNLWNGMLKDSERGEQRVHPMQKPVIVMAWAMEQAKVPEGATVLDPYMGSGTTGIACLRTGRNFVGIEKDQKHFATAVARLKCEANQGVLL